MLVVFCKAKVGIYSFETAMLRNTAIPLVTIVPDHVKIGLRPKNSQVEW